MPSPTGKPSGDCCSLRHLAGSAWSMTTRQPEFAAPDTGTASGPEIHSPRSTGSELTAGLLRAGNPSRRVSARARTGAARRRARARASEIDRAFDERERQEAGQTAAPRATTRSSSPTLATATLFGRSWIEQGGGLLAADAPMLSFAMMEMFEAASLRADRLRLPRRAGADLGAQDDAAQGRSVGPGRLAPGWLLHGRGPVAQPMAVALALRRRRPGPRHRAAPPRPLRRDRHRGGGARLHDLAAEGRGGGRRAHAIIRPIFEPGDALFFDELFLHQTGSSPEMPNPRYAVENWFFGGSGSRANTRRLPSSHRKRSSARAVRQSPSPDGAWFADARRRRAEHYASRRPRPASELAR